MPFTNGIFANVSGASSAAAGQIVQSAVWNAIHEDYSDALNQLMSQLLSGISLRNICWMNGGFEIWQRGAGSSASIAVGAGTTAYTADRWYLTTGANQASVVSAQTGLANTSQLSARVQRNSGQTGTIGMTFGYPLDTDEIIRMRGSKITLSFLASTGANWSPTNGTLVAALYVGTGAVGKRGGGFTSETTVLSISTNLAAGSSATSISATSSAAVPLTATQAEIQFTWTPDGTAGTNDYFQVDNLQLESNLSSDTWTPMNFDNIPREVALNGCKKHYQKTFLYDVAPASGGGIENALAHAPQATALVGLWWQYPVEMRSDPSFSKYHVVTATSSNWYNFSTSVTISAAFQASMGSSKSVLITGITASAIDVIYLLHAAADAGI